MSVHSATTIMTLPYLNLTKPLSHADKSAELLGPSGLTHDDASMKHLAFKGQMLRRIIIVVGSELASQLWYFYEAVCILRANTS